MTNPALAIHSDPDILGGKPVFLGSRVPFQAPTAIARHSTGGPALLSTGGQD